MLLYYSTEQIILPEETWVNLWSFANVSLYAVYQNLSNLMIGILCLMRLLNYRNVIQEIVS